MTDADLVHVTVSDLGKQVLAERMRSKDSPPLPGIPDDVSEPSFSAYETLDGQLFYHALAPIRREDSAEPQLLRTSTQPASNTIGYVQIAFSPEGMSREMHSIFATNLAIILGVIVAAAGIATIVMSRFIRRVIQPLREISETALRMADGDLSQTVSVNSSDEVGNLALAFNRMSHSLREQTNQLHLQTMELQTTNAALERTSQVKSEFLSNVSHELRTPLTSIRSFSEILMTYADEDPQTRQEFVHIINQESERLTRLINDVLDLSKIEAGRMDWNIEHQPMDGLLARVGDIMQGMAEAANLTLDIKMDPSLPEIDYDQDRMIQVLTNLVNNAIKFTDEGGVVLSATQEAKAIHISVADTGMGIPAEHQEAIFDKFHQVGDVLTDKPKGTGLGLSICKQIVEHHQGRIWVESEANRGSTFHILLPLTAGDPLDSIPEPTPESVLSAIPAHTSALILVADDEPNIRRSLCFTLSKMGYAILEAQTGRQALDLTLKHMPDLVILDIMMPELDGFDVIKSLRECGEPEVASIPILATSILEFQDKALQIGANDYHPKPIDRVSLLDSVRYLLPQQARKILVIDDEVPITKAICYELGRAGYQTSTAQNGREGLQLCRQELPDLIILDVMMPVMNGYEMLRELRAEEQFSHIPVIVLTANGLPGDRSKALGLGAQQFITKGEQFQTLLQEINQLLSKPRTSEPKDTGHSSQ